MENVKESENAKQQHRSIANEEENFDTFIKAMTRWGHAMLFPHFFNDKLAVDLLIFMGNE